MPHKLGDVVKMSDESAQLIAYYRNNVLHLFALPSLVACAFIGNSMLRTEDIQRLAWRIYPYVASELFLRWSEEELPRWSTACLLRSPTLGVLRRRTRIAAPGCGPPPDSPEAMQLSMLAQAHHPDHRALLPRHLAAAQGRQRHASPRKRSRSDCQLAAQRMNMLYGFNSPEFFDRALFENFIDLLRERGVIRVGAGGSLEFDEVLVRVAADAQLVLSEQIRHSILQVTQRLTAQEFPGKDGLALPVKAAAILARNTSALRHPRGEAAVRQRQQAIRTSGKSALASSLVAVPRSAGEVNE